ncbi:hypothetical protein [Lysinibacillus xylanilyticus]|uniref:Uncharacterized protein n=1 Tax=Lysinibacillus xylanilyticus TaxID=582475 RepID=A0A2M9Q765_9BACI|nr:hypothetical protein [Lysinibacillus xylanilyticus]PJO43908.1 hypothetical protein CWD94_09965 [Lysinibacillus xylanilyticus]
MTKRTDDLKKIKNLLNEDILEKDANKFEKLEITTKKYLDSLSSFATAKAEVNKVYEELVATANDFFDQDKLNESLSLVESPKIKKDIELELESSSLSSEYLSLTLIENPFDNEQTRIEAEREIDIIIKLQNPVSETYKRATFGSKFRSFWDDCNK